ncbi:phosphoglycerate kinase [Chloropicon primus]|uniref:Phosphoglycerate kinase n=1 Tax=Chloropicon primus TaxID=1764295 RepID=A0A5B8MGR0_9CHLO|nr:phosphoglycerate kinase [Chloropicon primus]UPQ99079.1 phosphoglycerate kinase [Chloropicon primus]|eukprot:QDZ19868.1 phosphoglycerate kinase [Chloropicon primus]
MMMSCRVVGGQRVRGGRRAMNAAVVGGSSATVAGFSCSSATSTCCVGSSQGLLSSGASRMMGSGLSRFQRRQANLIRRGAKLIVEAAKRSVGDLSEADLKGKKVFVRADLNVPLDGDCNITDDTRIRAAVPTLKYLLDKGAKVLLTSHLGRPKDGPEDKFRLNPVVPRLSELLGMEVGKVDDCVGADVTAKVDAMADGEIVVLENVRFYKEETKNEAGFAEKLAANADMFVNDAFGTAHRAHASTEGVTKYLSPAVSGFLLQKELDYLDGAVSDPKKPFCAIVGGSKVSSKIGVIESLMEKCDKIIIGGGMIFTFYVARGLSVGASLVEEDKVELARDLEKKAAEMGVEFLLPTDVVLADNFAPDANTQTVSIDAIPDGWMGLDIGPESLKTFQDALGDCKTVVWNGPMGVFEFDAFAAGTVGIADTLAEISGKGCCTIIGGGDSVAAVEKAGVADKMSHISTGGGASLELLEGKVLPGVAALDETVAVSA